MLARRSFGGSGARGPTSAPAGRSERSVGAADAGTWPAWPAWSGPAAVAGGFALVALASPLVRTTVAAAGTRVPAHGLPVGIAIAIEGLREVSLASVAIWMAWRLTPTRGKERRGPQAPASWATALIAVAGLLIAVYLFGDLLLSVFGGQALSTDFTPIGATWRVPFVLDLLIVIGLAPVCEELLFRGYAFTALRSWRGVRVAALLTGLGWGALHLPVYPPLACAPLALLGVGLCLLYWKTGSLLPCIVAHSLNNASGYAAANHFSIPVKTGVVVGGPVLALGVAYLASRWGPVALLSNRGNRPPPTGGMARSALRP